MANVTVQMGKAFPANTTLGYTAMNSDAMPAYMSTVTDSTWGTRIRRITDTDGRRNRYPTDQPWSKDGTYLYLPSATTAAARRLLGGSTYTDLGAVTTTPNEIIWSNVTDDKGYAMHYSTRKLYTWVASTNTLTEVRDFSTQDADQPAAWSSINAGAVWNVSSDDHLVGFWAVRGDATWDCVAYDPVDDRIEAYLNVASVPTAVVVSVSGTYMIVDRGGTRYVYTMTARVGTTPGTFTLVGTIGDSGHGVPAIDHAGNDVYARGNGAGDIIRLSDCSTTQQLVTANQTLSNGYCAYAIERPGWVYWGAEYVTSVPNESQTGYGQMLAVKTDGSGITQVFGFNHNMNTSASGSGLAYEKRPFATPNRDGTKVIFGGDWHGGGAYSGSVYCYVAGMLA